MSAMQPTERICVVAGHLCLYIIPDLDTRHADLRELEPGQLVNIGAATLATGGVVSNTGLALHRLGAPVRLLGKVGDDLLGQAVLNALRERDQTLTDNMIVARGESSSDTLVLSPPDVDRMFLHHPGCNDTFVSRDVPDRAFAGASHFHFGYPPLMKRIWERDGAELETLLRRAKAHGLSTSLDMTRPDPHAPAGQINWRDFLSRVLPFVDVFLPSWEELNFMLHPEDFPAHGALPFSHERLEIVTQELLQLGAVVAVVKLGERGLFAQVSDNAERLAYAPNIPREWLGQRAQAAPFEVDVVGTTGAGDSSIAGFLFGLLQGFSLSRSLQLASATAAYCCEARDATSGVRSWCEMQARLAAGWQQSPISTL